MTGNNKIDLHNNIKVIKTIASGIIRKIPSHALIEKRQNKKDHRRQQMSYFLSQLGISIEKNRCENCPWWRRLSNDTLIGECHKRAPVVLQTNGLLDFAGIWPETDWCEGCGDHPMISKFLEAKNAQ